MPLPSLYAVLTTFYCYPTAATVPVGVGLRTNCETCDELWDVYIEAGKVLSMVGIIYHNRVANVVIVRKSCPGERVILRAVPRQEAQVRPASRRDRQRRTQVHQEAGRKPNLFSGRYAWSPMLITA
jgi:hypothetical protein